MSCVYVLWSDKLARRYEGSGSDPDARLRQHNQGASIFTKRGGPWRLLYTEAYASNAEARRRERQLKTGMGRLFLNRTLSRAAGYPDSELPDNCVGYEIY